MASDHDAVWYLLVSNANVWLAMKMAKQHGHAMCDTSLRDAYREAAVESWHPDPDALAKFAVDSSLHTESAVVARWSHALLPRR